MTKMIFCGLPQHVLSIVSNIITIIDYFSNNLCSFTNALAFFVPLKTAFSRTEKLTTLYSHMCVYLCIFVDIQTYTHKHIKACLRRGATSCYRVRERKAAN